MTYCQQCGAEVDSGARYCPKCGTELGRPGGAPNDEPELSLSNQESEKKQQPLENRIAIGILMAVGMIVAIWLMFDGCSGLLSTGDVRKIEGTVEYEIRIEPLD
jgi:uncharacterized membrane protein YvbJ